MRLQAASPAKERWRWLIKGQVQGVGFRPFVCRLARSMKVQGFVRNDGGGVVIEGEGSQALLQRFDARIRRRPPILAEIRTIEHSKLAPRIESAPFQILSSDSAQAKLACTDVTADAALCDACANEIRDIGARRYRYPLTNCTDCGPRYSIVRAVPYDRCNTTMSHFQICPECSKEYHDPADRRFHAQPIACPKCGPQIALVDPRGGEIAGDPIDLARTMLRNGQILAIKGLGGFHLAVRADEPSAVERLRRLKRRDHKPLAVMVRSLEAAQALVELSPHAISLMRSPACPIVLAPRRPGVEIAPCVAPDTHRLGVMLPYTPLHHLLLAKMPPLVMTSGNLSDEPLAIDNDEALQRLSPLCDGFLWHDRSIQRGVDDSVVLDLPQGEPILLRRARGFVPISIPLPLGGASQGICVGGELKSTVAVVREGSAILSQHLGDLSHPAAFEAFGRAIDDLQNLFHVWPQWIACDLHPSYVSTMHARKVSATLGVPLLKVQHHHAHAAALLAEHGLSERILAIVCDGTGYGPDGTIWGGELLSADLLGFERLAHLQPLRLAGGDAAARDTARCALALLHQTFGNGFGSLPIVEELVPDPVRRAMLVRLVREDISCMRSSGAGRVFDGVAALLGLCMRNEYEAQSGMRLESAAAACGQSRRAGPDFFELHPGAAEQIDLSPLVRELVLQQARGVPVEELAMVLHEQFARAWSVAAGRAAMRIGIRVVGLSGGVFCNAFLTLRLTELLEAQNLRVLRHRFVPPNDGGLSLGQAAIAGARGMAGKDGA